MSLAPIARLIQGATAFNTLVVRTVDVFFQMSPGKPNGDVRGINALDFRVLANGVVLQTGTTGADGRIQMRIQGGVSTLQLLVAGVSVAEYTVTVRDDAIEAVTTSAGQQRRMRMLGYHIGHTGPEGTGVDGSAVPTTQIDRALLEVQADDNNAVNGLADAATQGVLTAAVGA